MSDMPFWLTAVLSVGLTLVLGAFLLPTVEAIYRLENWLATWPLAQLDRAERRDAFEEQLALFLERERRQGYQPHSSGLRLLFRMLSTLPIDLWEISRALAFSVPSVARTLAVHSFAVQLASYYRLTIFDWFEEEVWIRWKYRVRG